MLIVKLPPGFSKMLIQTLAEMIKPRNGIPGLELEVAVLKKLQKSPHFARYVDSGEYKSANYLIMQLL
uniref:Uncharacterized protein n=1 Tax=Romanomermis culicivorax TaxID=13658 RepID=A0A915HJZ0_ROMCU